MAEGMEGFEGAEGFEGVEVSVRRCGSARRCGSVRRCGRGFRQMEASTAEGGFPQKEQTSGTERGGCQRKGTWSVPSLSSLSVEAREIGGSSLQL